MPVPTTAAPASATGTAPPPACKSCFSQDLFVFYELPAVPVNSCLLLDDESSARRYPAGRIALAFCRGCGFIGNLRFDPALTRYTDAYEEQQSFSPTFNAFARDLAASLVERHGLRGKTVLEIGCGKGDFLLLLCELGAARGIGIDPTYVPGRHEGPAAARLEFVREFYSPDHARYGAGFVCCRHTLEHIPDTAEFMATVRAAVGGRKDVTVFFELPDVLRVLQEGAFWDIYYEHCSYFTPGSLARLFRRAGFEVTGLERVYNGQYLLLEALPGPPGGGGPPLPLEESPAQLLEEVVRFQTSCRNVVSKWKTEIARMRANGLRPAIWGSGSKCVSFLSTVGIADEVDCIVDINPHRHGRYLPGSGKRIFPPEYLREYRPGAVIVMNPIYTEEIRAHLGRLGVPADVTAL